MDDQWDAAQRSREVERREREADRREHEAERRGELSTNVQNLRLTLDEVRRSVQEIHNSIALFTKEMVTRKEFDDQKAVVRKELDTQGAQVSDLTTWKKVILAIIGLILFLSQVLPRIWDAGKKLGGP